MLTVLSDGQKFFPAVRICLLLRQLFCERGITFCIDDRRFTGDEHRLQKAGAACIVGVRNFTGIKRRFCPFGDTRKADGEHPIVMHRHMSDAVVKIVSGRKDVVFNGAARLGRHICRRQFARRFPFPICIRFGDLFFRRVRNIKRICAARRHGVKFRFKPFVGKFGIGLAAARRKSRAADDEFVVADYDRDILQDMQKGFCPAQNNGLAFRLSVRFGKQPGARRFYFRHFAKQVLL